jgi:hypothetical protein
LELGHARTTAVKDEVVISDDGDFFANETNMKRRKMIDGT